MATDNGTRSMSTASIFSALAFMTTVGIETTATVLSGAPQRPHCQSGRPRAPVRKGPRHLHCRGWNDAPAAAEAAVPQRRHQRGAAGLPAHTHHPAARGPSRRRHGLRTLCPRRRKLIHSLQPDHTPADQYVPPQWDGAPRTPRASTTLRPCGRSAGCPMPWNDCRRSRTTTVRVCILERKATCVPWLPLRCAWCWRSWCGRSL